MSRDRDPLRNETIFRENTHLHSCRNFSGLARLLIWCNAYCDVIEYTSLSKSRNDIGGAVGTSVKTLPLLGSPLSRGKLDSHRLAFSRETTNTLIQSTLLEAGQPYGDTDSYREHHRQRWWPSCSFQSHPSLPVTVRKILFFFLCGELFWRWWPLP